LSGSDPVVLYQDLSSPSTRRAESTTRPALRAKLIEALGPKLGERIVHVGAGAGYYSAIPAELVGPAGQVTAVEFDAALAERAESFFSGRTNVRVVCDDGAHWPDTPADGVYVNFGRFSAGGSLDREPRTRRPADVPARRPGTEAAEFRRPAQRPRRGAQWRGDAYPARAVSTAYFACAKEDSRLIPTIWRGCAPPSRPAASTQSAA
jgi:protein-L-isoaspartate(D-aspartate) O-methyltransferase